MKSVIIKGFGRNGLNVAQTHPLPHYNFKIVGITQGDLGIYNQIGIDHFK